MLRVSWPENVSSDKFLEKIKKIIVNIRKRQMIILEPVMRNNIPDELV